MKPRSTKYWIIVFLIPALVLFLGFYAYSFITVIVTGFSEWKLGEEVRFIGMTNYRKLFQDATFIQALKNTLKWLVLYWTVLVGTSLMVALVTIKKTWGSRIVRVLYLIPKMIPMAVVGFLFYFMFNPSVGLVNDLLELIGLGHLAKNWFVDSQTAFWAVTVTTVFYGGVFMLMMSSEISAVPGEVYESARVDGATDLQINLYIVLPLIKNIIGTCLILATVDCLRAFEVIYLTTSGGPGNLTMNLPILIYRTAMNNSNYGYANAVASITIVIGAIAILVINHIFGAKKEDER